MLAVGAAGLGYGAITQALAYSLRSSAIERAYMLAPNDGRITALLSEKRSGPQANPADRVEADRLARIALRDDPTTVAAVATLGINAQIRGDTVSARRLFAYSQALSRRDLRTQLWGVEDAVARNDIPGALRHYDIALRTSRAAPELLFPVLAGAIDDTDIRAALIDTLVGKPIWGEGFIHYAAGNGPNPRATADLLRGLQRAGVPVSNAARTAMVNVLIAGNLVDEAWSYYASVRPGADRSRLRDPDFTADLAEPAPFDWVPSNDAGVTASIQRDDTGGVFDFATTASVGGTLLRQMQILPAGDYALSGRSIAIDQPERSRPYWLLACADGRELGRVEMSNSVEADGRFAGRLRVPADCLVQFLSFVARPSDMMAGLSGQIDRVELRPAG